MMCVTCPGDQFILLDNGPEGAETCMRHLVDRGYSPVKCSCWHNY
jgi:hypothetical protein